MSGSKSYRNRILLTSGCCKQAIAQVCAVCSPQSGILSAIEILRQLTAATASKMSGLPKRDVTRESLTRGPTVRGFGPQSHRRRLCRHLEPQRSLSVSDQTLKSQLSNLASSSVLTLQSAERGEAALGNR